MPPDSDEGTLQSKVSGLGTSVFVMPATTGTALCPTALPERHDIKGTVNAAIMPFEACSYSIGREPVIVATPYRAAGRSHSQDQEKGRTRPRAIDLISELQEISGQVNRMMAQVERAIDRLAVDAG